MAGKKAHVDFNKKFEKLILELGATPRDGRGSYQWLIVTKGGDLLLNVHEPDASILFSIYCKFEDPDLAKVAVGYADWTSRLNPHTGKWNFHLRHPDELLEQFKNEITKIL